jgi:hypothetical protein
VFFRPPRVLRYDADAMRLRWLALLLPCLLATAQEWTPLFDGRMLNGWRVEAKPADVDRGFWQADDGVIAGDSRGQPNHGYMRLLNEREFHNFELRLEVRSF